MNIYKMNNEKLKEMAADFNNTMYGRRIWLLSKIPEVLACLSLSLYIVFTIIGAYNPNIKDLIADYILADLIVLGVSFIAIGFAEVGYWKQVNKYVSKLESSPKETIQKEIKEVTTKVKDTVKKTVKNVKKEIPKVKKEVKKTVAKIKK